MGLRTLIVEDNPDVAEALMLLLKHHGHEATSVISVKRALEELHDKDLVLIDIRVTDGDGLAVFRRIRDRHKLMRVIITSGYTTEHNQELVDLKPDAVFTKPLDLERLLKTIDGFQVPPGDADHGNHSYA